jgi:metal-responsive CopG/Arc/MetJ family transcriptional regulator
MESVMEKIQRSTIWLSPNIMNSLDDMKSKANCKSRSEFIEQAIKFYSEYNDSMNKGQYLPLSISSAMNGMIKVSEDRISKRLFKNTVELSMIMNVLSATVDIDNDTLKKLRVKCIREINGTNGKLDFEEINRYQKSWC